MFTGNKHEIRHWPIK